MTAGRGRARAVSLVAAFLVACALLAGSPAFARDIVLPPPTDGMEGEHAAAAKGQTQGQARDFKSTHVNRCRGPDGVVVLQDAPCPTVAAPSTAPQPAVEVVELSALAPRPLANTVVAKEEGPPRSLLAGVLDGAWKLGLLVLAGYLLYRGIGSVRGTLRQRRVTSPSPMATRGRRSRPR